MGKWSVKNIVKAVTQPITDTFVGVRQDVQSAGKLLTGDIKGWQEEFVDARTEMAKGGAGTMVPLAEVTAPGVIETAGNVSEALKSPA